MLVKECMTKKVELGTPNMSLYEVAQKMRDGDFGVLPIQENDRLVGIVTDRDIAVRGVTKGKDPKQIKARDVMSDKVLYCYEDQSLEEVAQNLGENQICRLPVMNRQKRLVGILSLGDLAKSHVNPEKFETSISHLKNKTKSTEARIH